MQAVLAALVDEMRNIGLGVSVGEHIDAARALTRIPVSDKEVVRAALQGTLVKRAEHVDTFNLLFDLLTAGTQQQPGAELAAAMTDEELRQTLRSALQGSDAQLRRLLADEYVRRFGGLEPGRPVAGVFATLAVEQAADIEGLPADLTGGGGGSGAGDGTGSGLGGRLAAAAADRAVAEFSSELRAAVRRALVADRGAQAVRATMRVTLAEDIEITTASAADQAAMTAAIGPLSQQLARVLAQQAAHRNRRLSLRRTLHRAMGTGGVPLRLVTEPARPPRPEIVVLADMSGSVSAFSRFTLDLLAALDGRLNRLRVFAFVDGLAEITDLVRQARAAGRRLDPREVAAGAVRLSGSSDYGWVLREFARTHAHQLGKRSVVLVTGDARSNYGDPGEAAFAEISGRAGRVYWLDPEPRRNWNDGDSVIARYQPWCAQVRECRTLRQITEFVESLALSSLR
jgi:uncharacterized protein with von Willebrand factor type A (vWA) domain